MARRQGGLNVRLCGIGAVTTGKRGRRGEVARVSTAVSGGSGGSGGGSARSSLGRKKKTDAGAREELPGRKKRGEEELAGEEEERRGKCTAAQRVCAP